MSDIQEKLDIIKHGTYGRDIRTAIHDSIRDISEDGGGGGVGYIIAPPNASEEDKAKADLVLDDVNGSPHIQLADVVDILHNRRGENTDIAIVIEFCPGIVELPYDTNWEISEGNVYIYGNGVKIEGYRPFTSLLNIKGCWLHDVTVENTGDGDGIEADSSTLSNCSGTGSEYGRGVKADNSTLSNCSGSSGIAKGLTATNSTLSNCSGSSGGSDGIWASNSTLSNCAGNGGLDGDGISANISILSNCTGSGDTGINATPFCIIQGCDGTQGGISVPNGFEGTYPNTSALLHAFNKGSIIERDW